jgi:hypothetical protein
MFISCDEKKKLKGKSILSETLPAIDCCYEKLIIILSVTRKRIDVYLKHTREILVRYKKLIILREVQLMYIR